MLVIFDENSKKPDAETHPTITDRIKYADTFVHELQHVDIDFNSLLSSQPLLHPDIQHDMMNDKEDKYWKARYNFFYSYYDFWKEDLNSILADNPTNLISSTCGSISTSNTMEINIRNYTCDKIEAHGPPR